jgi:aldehyde dehydrogenase (NAD+)
MSTTSQIPTHPLQFYIDGAWIDPAVPRQLEVIDPATEQAFTSISVGSAADVNKAVSAAKKAFPGFSRTSKAERLALLRRVLEVYNAHYEAIAQAVSQEMGAPLAMPRPLSGEPTWRRRLRRWRASISKSSAVRAGW